MTTSSVNLNSKLIAEATCEGESLNRTPSKQIEHWAKIGKMAEENPDLPYDFLKRVLTGMAELESGKVDTYVWDDK